ncbi:MAG: replication-relaxation family protein [Patescibacteria group bacterium]
MSPRKPKTDQKRLPRTKRAKHPPAFRITKRDVELVRAILNYRFLYTKHVFWLLPKASQQNLTVRLRHLYHHGYLNRVLLPDSSTNEQLVYAPTEKGAVMVADADGISRDEVEWHRYMNIVSPSHIRHLLSINDVLVSYEIALGQAKAQGKIADYKVVRGEPRKHKLPVLLRDKDGKRREVANVPDAYLAVVFDSHNYGVFFVEVDRATMGSSRWAEKIEVYREYPRTQHFKDKFKAQWCIVLTVAPSEKRVMSLAEKTAGMGGQRGFWYALADQLTPDTACGPVWIRASDLFGVRNERVVKLSEISRAIRSGLPDALR